MTTQTTLTLHQARKKLSASNLHELLNDMNTLSKFIELIEERGVPYSIFETQINELGNKINSLIAGKPLKAKSKAHSWPSWILKIGD